MTKICPGNGPSGPLPGTPAVVTLTAVAVDSLLIAAGFEIVAAVIAPYLAAQVFEVGEFCATDPPADPGLTAQDMLDVVNMTDPTVSFPAIAKFKQWWARYEWYLLCG